jgi:hypothetical protein
MMAARRVAATLQGESRENPFGLQLFSSFFSKISKKVISFADKYKRRLKLLISEL